MTRIKTEAAIKSEVGFLADIRPVCQLVFFLLQIIISNETHHTIARRYISERWREGGPTPVHLLDSAVGTPDDNFLVA